MEFQTVFIFVIVFYCSVHVDKSTTLIPIFNQRTNSFWNILGLSRKDTKQLSDNKTQEDGKLLTNELIMKYKYPAEQHKVITEDGYILTMHRIPKSGHQPILLIHGLFDSSAAFVIMGPNISLGYLLHENGYDVWLGNCRGNRYSRQHRTTKPTNPEFWNFSFHEIGIYDLPAMINHILSTTNFERLHYIGHSQGATAFFVMCSMKPEFNEKILLMQGFAPLTFIDNIKSPLLNSIESYLKSDKSISKTEIMPVGWWNRATKCALNRISRWFCIQVIFALIGKDVEQLNESFLPILFGHMPAGGSIQQIRHYAQIYQSKKFQTFGSDRTASVEYNLSAISVPILLYYGENDYLAVPEDVHRLHQTLISIQGLYQIPIKAFNHMGFVWSNKVATFFYKKLFMNVFNGFIAGTLKYVIE